MLEMVGVAMVGMGQLVPADIQNRTAVEGNDGRQSPVVVHLHLQRAYTLVHYCVVLGEERQGYEYPEGS